MTATDGYKKAIIDWVLAHGTPMSTFGPAGRLTALTDLRALDHLGIDYAQSTVGDIGGESWCDNTYDEATTHPGVWADIIALGDTPDRLGRPHHPSGRWFVAGEGMTLDRILREVLEAADIGDTIWKIRIAEEATR